MSKTPADQALPKTMKALFLKEIISDLKGDISNAFEVKEVDVPQPKSGEVLVKIECSPINPSDLSTLTGTYNKSQRATLPCQLGFEGSGTVVANGGGLLGWMVNGKRVGVVTVGSGCIWAEYAVIPAATCSPLPDDVTFEEGCSVFVNPMTAVAFVDIAKAQKVTTIVHTAAASTLGKMLVKYAATQGVNVICVVRRPEHAEALQKIGAKDIVITQGDQWITQLTDLCAARKATIGFDAVAGELSGQVIRAMPRGSHLYVYGGLSYQACAVNPSELIFSQKTLHGFWLTGYLAEKSMLTKKGMVDRVRENLKTCFAAEIRAEYALSDAAAAIKDYTANMSDGKIVFRPAK